MTRAVDRRGVWLGLLTLALGVHAMLSVVFPDAGWTTSAGVGANLLLAIALCLVRAGGADREMRWRWAMLAAVFAIWIGAFASIAYLQSVLMADTSRALPFGLYFMLRGVPVLLLLARSGDTDEGRIFFRLDSAQALLFAGLAIVVLFPSVLSGGGRAAPFVPDLVAMHYHDIQNFGLALLSIAALAGQPAGERRRFAYALCGVLASYAPTVAFLNHWLIAVLPPPPPGALFNMIADVPVAVLVVVAGGPRWQPSHDRTERRFARLFRLLLPVGFCGASLVASFAVSTNYPAIGLATAATGLALYALRSALVVHQLRQLQRFVADVVERLPDALCVVGANGTISLGNDAASRLFGTDVRGAVFAGLVERLGLRSDVGEVGTPDGRTWAIAEAPLEAGGKIVRFSDITRIRETERDREEALQFLSHDMRSPIAGIVKLLEGRDAADLSDAPPDLFDRVRRFARHGLAMADDFVRLARLNSAGPAHEPVDLGDAAAEAADIVWPLAKERLIAVSEDPRVEAWIMGDRALLIRAVYNLLDNGVKFAPPGSVLTYGVSVSGALASLHVSGPGTAFPPARAADLFKPFGPGRAAAGRGSVGLGLAFVQTAIEMQGGTVRYEAGGDGHVFVIELPLLPEL